MSPDGKIKVVSELLDLPLFDVEGKYCGIVDDVELAGGPGKALELKALLVGPGAYQGRMPAWMFWLVRKAVGDRLARVPTAQIASIGSVVKLKCAAEDLKLHVFEDKVREWIPRWGAM